MSEHLKEETLVEELKYKDKPVKLINPGFDGMAPFLRIAVEMSKKKDLKPEEFMTNLSKDAIEDILLLVKLTVKKTFKDKFKTEQEEIETWTMKNLVVLMGKVIEICSPKKTHGQRKKADLIKKLHDKQSAE